MHLGRLFGKAMRLVGWAWGASVLRYSLLAYARRRVSKLDIVADGVENVAELRGRSYIVVSNHLYPRDHILRIFSRRSMHRFNHSIDSFVFQKVIKDRTGELILVVAKYGRDTWHESRVKRFLQRYIRQPLTRGQLEGMGYLPVDLKEGSLHRDFLKAAGRAIRRRRALLIFPSAASDDFQSNADVRSGAAHLAHKHQVPVLPAYIAGSESWHPGQRVSLRFGTAIRTEGLSKQQIFDEIKRRIVALEHPENAGDDAGVPPPSSTSPK